MGDKINIIIQGDNIYTVYLMNIVNLDKVCIQGILDESCEVVYKFVDELKTKAIPIKLEDCEYDYIVICDDAMDIFKKEKEKVLDFKLFLQWFVTYSPEFLYSYYECYKKRDLSYEGIITGLSYIQGAVLEDKLIKPFAKMAHASQDIFYDFEMFKHVFQQESLSENKIKYAIIGLGLYSFHYDMTKSSKTALRALYYLPYTGKLHNIDNREKYEQFYYGTVGTYENILVENYKDVIWEIQREDIIKTLRESYNHEFQELMSEQEKIQIALDAYADFHKYYPESVKENERILEEYLNFLKTHNIKVLVIIPPVTKIYQQYIPAEMEEELLQIINILREKFSFEFWNLSRSDHFKNEEFRDASHLNIKGAAKLTEMINGWLSE